MFIKSKHKLFLTLLICGLLLFLLLSTFLVNTQASRVEQEISLTNKGLPSVLIILKSFDPPSQNMLVGVKIFDYGWGFAGLEPWGNIPALAAKYKENSMPALIPLIGNPELYPFDTYENTIRINGKDEHNLILYQDGMRDFEYTVSVTTQPFECCDIITPPDVASAFAMPRYGPPSLSAAAVNPEDGSNESGPTVYEDRSPKVEMRVVRPISIRITVAVTVIIIGLAIWMLPFVTDKSTFFGVAISVLLGIWSLRPILIPPSITWPLLLDQIFIIYYFWLFGLIFLQILSDRNTEPPPSPKQRKKSKT